MMHVVVDVQHDLAAAVDLRHFLGRQFLIRQYGKEMRMFSPIGAHFPRITIIIPSPSHIHPPPCIGHICGNTLQNFHTLRHRRSNKRNVNVALHLLRIVNERVVAKRKIGRLDVKCLCGVFDICVLEGKDVLIAPHTLLKIHVVAPHGVPHHEHSRMSLPYVQQFVRDHTACQTQQHRVRSHMFPHKGDARTLPIPLPFLLKRPKSPLVETPR